MSFVMLWEQLRAAEERLQAAVRTVDLKQLLEDTPVRQAVERFAIQHYDAHWTGLREAYEDLELNG